MAIVAQDSTTVYYDIYNGMKKPGDMEAINELLASNE